MADTTLTFSPPLPEDLKKLTITWATGKPGKEKPVAREQAQAALVERTFASGITRTARYTVPEADALIAEVDRAQGRRPRRAPTPAPAPAPVPAPRPKVTPRPKATPTPAPAPRTTPGTTGASRAKCVRCGGVMKTLGPRHSLTVGSLDGFYARGLNGAELSVATVYEYECGTCHALQSFTTAR